MGEDWVTLFMDDDFAKISFECTIRLTETKHSI